MKTSTKIFATFAFIGAMIFSAGYSPCQTTSGQVDLSYSYKAEKNWISAWKSFHGQQSDASWLLNLADDETNVWMSKDGAQFIIVSKTDADEPAIDEFDLTEFPGNNATCKLAWTGDIYELDILAASADFSGTISGKDVKANRIEMITDNNDKYTIIVMGSSNTELEQMEETGFAFMTTFSDVAARTAASE